MRPSCAYHHAQKRFASGNKREAKRRKAHANHVPRIADKCTQSAPLICCAAARRIGARPPSGASPRLSQGLPSLTQLQAMLPATWNQAGVTRPIPSQSSDSTSRLGRSTEGNDARSRSGADCESARKHRTRSTLQIASGMRPSMSEIPWLVPDLVTDVKYRRDNETGCLTAYARALSRPSRLGGQSANGRDARPSGRDNKIGPALDCSWAGPVSPAGCASDGGRTSVGPAQSQMRDGFGPIWFKPRGPRAGFRASGQPAPGRAGYRAPDNARRPLLSVWRARPRARCFADEPCRARR